jgi:DNA phosphorothioation-dependent restriction protein DptG
MIAYAITSYVAQVMNGKPVYFILDWESWIAPVATIGVFALANVIYYSLFGFSIMKHKLFYPKLKQPKPEVEELP